LCTIDELSHEVPRPVFGEMLSLMDVVKELASRCVSHDYSYLTLQLDVFVDSHDISMN